MLGPGVRIERHLMQHTLPWIAFDAASAGIVLGYFLCGADLGFSVEGFRLCGDMSSETGSRQFLSLASMALFFVVQAFLALVGVLAVPSISSCVTAS